jgi:hypothetical protein
LDRARNTPRTPEAFIQEAEGPQANPSAALSGTPQVPVRPPAADSARPAAAAARTGFTAPPLDPEAVPRNAFNLRLNDYELDMLRRAAAQTRPKQSMQQVIKQGLIPYLERLVGVR